MAIDIRVPEFGESVSEAVVGRWLKAEGDTVGPDEPIVELETDKVAVEVTAEQAGVLGKIVQAEGATVAVGDILITLEAGDAPAATSTRSEMTPSISEAPTTTQANGAGAGNTDALATPVARRVATEHDIDLARISGTGPGGRIVKNDLTSHIGRDVPPAPAPSVSPPTPSGGPALDALAPIRALFAPPEREERIRMSRRRQTIARRLVEAQQTAAMLTTFNEIDMTAIMEVRKRRRDQFKERHAVGLGFMSFFTKAAIGALKAFPSLNAEIQGDEIVLKRHYDIGVAVGAEEGLVVPVLRDADQKSFADIEREIGILATKARENKLSLAELQGGTFTITNGGTFGSLLSTPILNVPEVAILGMHKIQERAVVVKGEIVVRPMMYLALSYDHRIVDGREAVQFLVRIKELVEDPETLLLEG